MSLYLEFLNAVFDAASKIMNKIVDSSQFKEKRLLLISLKSGHDFKNEQ
jgi:hypothetical protein